jgi:hypothetical protein
MGQAIVGLSIFVGLQIVLFLVLFGVTLWERRQLDRPIAQPVPLPSERPSRSSSTAIPSPEERDLPLSA